MAAEAMAAALEHRAPDADIECIDLVQAGGSRLLRRLPQAYSTTIRLAPWLYDWFWQHTGPRWIRWTGERSGPPRATSGVRELVAQAQPDAVVCTHAMAARLAAALRQEGMAFRHIAVFTDFGCHRYWPTEGVDHFVTSADGVTAELVSRGVPAERVHACGIPVRSSLWHGAPRMAGSPAAPGNGLPTVLAMAGSTQRGLYRAAAESARRLVTAHAHDPSAYRLTVVTGGDAALLRRLRPLAAPEPAGVPLVYVGGCAGQERANVEHTVQSGAAIHVPRPAEVPAALADVLRRRGALAAMAQQARCLGRPHAALHAARLTLRAVDAARGQDGLHRQSPTAVGRALGRVSQ
jgi:processive 1,2-diacylglycerol beta-glucosyltransferase